ncbi:hypothetical protein CCUG60884_00170 [Mycobacteroides salmoniphilum]|uniref:Uncharacterized protein n=1 Tax=Mycobacteroides salmoniphilum TaxID=404941 RepID=A0A4R8SZW4_9MYCO|nr:hypothetical protein CCUG60884_00170 [Mycobacteroides salmoniphilum]
METMKAVVCVGNWMRGTNRGVLSITVAGEISRREGRQIPAEVCAAIIDLPRAVYAAGGMDNRGEFVVRLSTVCEYLAESVT